MTTAIPIPPEARDEVLSWFKLRAKVTGSLTEKLPGWLPWDTGFYVPGVGAGFLVLTNSDRAYIEDFVTNPDTTPEQRDSALFAIAQAVEDEARKRGVKYLLGYSPLEIIWKRVESVGYRVWDRPLKAYGKKLADT